MKKNIWISLGVSLASILAIFALTSQWTDLTQVIILKPRYLFWLVLTYMVQWVVGGMRMQVVAAGLGKKVDLLRGVKISFCGDYFAQITPSSIGGQPAKVMMLATDEKKYGKSSAIVAVENASEILFFLLMIPVALIQNPFSMKMLEGNQNSWIFVPISLLVATGLIYIVMIKSHWIVALIDKFLQLPLVRSLVTLKRRERIITALGHEMGEFGSSIVHYFQYSKYHLFMTMLLSVVYWSLRFTLLYLVVQGFGMNVEYWVIYQMQILLFFFTLFIPTPGGGAEFILVLLLNRTIPAGVIASVIMNWRFFTFFLTLILGSLVVFMGAVQLVRVKETVGEG